MSAEVSHLVVSDCHGCYYTLVRLLNRCPHGAQLILNGDLIDRGPHSRKVVEFAMANEVPTVLGNHEHLCLAYYDLVPWRGFYERGVWLHNGGDVALGNWPTMHANGYPDGNRVPDDVLNWMKGLPYYLIPEDAPRDENGRSLLVSHTGYGLDVTRKGRDTWFRALWGRRRLGDGSWVGHDPVTGEETDDGHYRVYGHTQEKVADVTDTYAMIDTGAAYGARGYGNLTAFLWPTKQVLTQPFDENPAILTWVGSQGAWVAP